MRIDIVNKQYYTPEEMARYRELEEKTSYAGLRKLSTEVASEYFNEEPDNRGAIRDSLKIQAEKAIEQEQKLGAKEQEQGAEVFMQGTMQGERWELGGDIAKIKAPRHKSVDEREI